MASVNGTSSITMSGMTAPPWTLVPVAVAAAAGAVSFAATVGACGASVAAGIGVLSFTASGWTGLSVPAGLALAGADFSEVFWAKPGKAQATSPTSVNMQIFRFI